MEFAVPEGSVIVMARRKTNMALVRRARAEVAEQREARRTLPPEFLHWLRNVYEPKSRGQVELDALRAFIEEVLTASNAAGDASLRRHTSRLAGLAEWLHAMGHPLTAASVSRVLIDQYVGAGRGSVLDKSRSDLRSKLRQLADQLHPEAVPARGETIPRPEVKAPYTDREVAAFVRVAGVQPTPALVRKLKVCIGLGLGSGIDSPDLKLLTRTDVIDHGDRGIEVRVPGDRARVVWVLREYEDMVRAGLLGLADGQLLIGQVKDRHNVAAAIYDGATFLGSTPKPEQSRLRTTWLVTLMGRPVPLGTLCRAAGLRSTRTLFDLLPYAPQAPDADSLRDGGAR